MILLRLRLQFDWTHLHYISTVTCTSPIRIYKKNSGRLSTLVTLIPVRIQLAEVVVKNLLLLPGSTTLDRPQRRRGRRRPKNTRKRDMENKMWTVGVGYSCMKEMWKCGWRLETRGLWSTGLRWQRQNISQITGEMLRLDRTACQSSTVPRLRTAKTPSVVRGPFTEVIKILKTSAYLIGRCPVHWAYRQRAGCCCRLGNGDAPSGWNRHPGPCIRGELSAAVSDKIDFCPVHTHHAK